MKRSSPPRRKTPMPRPSKPMARGRVKARNRERRDREFARCYHSVERVAWVKSLPCAGCGVVGFSDNAHVCGNAGAHRKGNAETIAPLCHDRFDIVGCHTKYDRYLTPFRSESSRRRIRAEATVTARTWRDLQEAA